VSVRTAAEREEEAELDYLRDQAERATVDAARALAELAARIAVARRPGQAARRLTVRALAAALRALREGPGSGQRGAWRPALAAVPVLLLAGALAYAIARGRGEGQQARAGHPERVRAFARARK
jgi:hypothetical protein